MYFSKHKTNDIQSRFSNYTLGIKSELLNQIISENSSSRLYFEIQYDQLSDKYLDIINNLNYNKICSRFVHDVYELIPINDTM